MILEWCMKNKTEYLLRSPNAKRLLTAWNRAFENSIKPSSLKELKRELNLDMGQPPQAHQDHTLSQTYPYKL